MSTENQSIPKPCICYSVGPNLPLDHLSVDDLFDLQITVKDRIKTIVHKRWDIINQRLDADAVMAARSDPYGRVLVALLGKLEHMQYQTFLLELAELSNEKNNPRWQAAVEVYKRDRPHIPYSIKKPADLYFALNERGYRWDRKSQTWVKRGEL